LGATPNTRALQDHTGAIDCLRVSSDGRQVLSGARDGKVRIHDVDGRLVRTYQGLGEQVWALCRFADGGVVAGLADGALYRLVSDSDQAVRLRAAGDAPVFSLGTVNDQLVIGNRDRITIRQ
jgi:WD40 repeat protein